MRAAALTPLPAPEHESIKLRASGFELHAHVWEGGRGEGGQSDPVLLLHGLGGNSVTWHGVAPLVAHALGTRVLAVDLPGFGASHPGGQDVRFSVLASVVASILNDAPRGVRFHVAGNSLGGLLALHAAFGLPERVKRVTLAALSLPLAWGRGPRDLWALRSYLPAATPWLGRRLVARYTRATGVPGIVDDPIAWLFADPTRLEPELRSRLLAVSSYRLTWVEQAALALEQTTLGLGAALLLPDRAPRWIRDVRCPVRNVWGDRDPIYPAAAWQRLERERPDWEHVCMPGVGHVPQLEAPAEFARVMLSP